jgi:hypothetical protein
MVTRPRSTEPATDSPTAVVDDPDVLPGDDTDGASDKVGLETPDNESDDDLSDAPLGDDVGVVDSQDDAQDSVETAPLVTTDRVEEIASKETQCRVIITSKTPDGFTLFCGMPADSCTRRSHRQKQPFPSKRAAPGVYEGVLNASKKIVDGLLETYVSFEERDAITANTIEEMDSAMKSQQKVTSESVQKPKTPTVLAFDLEDKPPASSQS